MTKKFNLLSLISGLSMKTIDFFYIGNSFKSHKAIVDDIKKKGTDI